MAFTDGHTRAQRIPASWQSRFAFFDAHGSPAGTAYREALRQSPLGLRCRIAFNPLAFFFGAFYFLCKGMWRKGLAILGFVVVVSIVLLPFDTPSQVDLAIGYGVSAVCATTANHQWYLHVRRNSRSWNPFEGMSRRRS
ncbi:DUF2628 domain-containing protein [Gordonia aurantiaca]|uniref:DUF2628 domain-containing protein n=1 Tax=Gordonia sp. B21 TaxID=3151852 RepID=UPI0032648E09